jgi:hypothetical protein
LPVLVDLAANHQDEDSRQIAFRALAEQDIHPFAERLHRSAGDSERRIRFAAATALVPTGEAWAMRLLVSEMDRDVQGETLAARRSIDRLPEIEARRLLEEMFWDGTGTPFTTDILFGLIGEVSERIEQRAWELVSSRTNDPYALLVAAQLDFPEAAQSVISHLEK